MNQFYTCELCDKYFNGIVPYKDHLASEKHKNKMNPPLCAVENSSGLVNESEDLKSDQHIKKYGNEYKCLACQVVMNSISTALSHSKGQKHLKTIRCNSSDSGISSNNSTAISSNNNTAISSTIFGSENLDDEFSLHFTGIEDMLKDVKVIQVDDPVEF